MMGESVRLPVHPHPRRPHLAASLSIMIWMNSSKFWGYVSTACSANILREFRSVRIDYNAHVIELEG